MKSNSALVQASCQTFGEQVGREQNCARKFVRQSARRGFSRYQTTLSPEATLKIYLIDANWCLNGHSRGLVKWPMWLQSDLVLCSLQNCRHSAEFAESAVIYRILRSTDCSSSVLI